MDTRCCASCGRNFVRGSFSRNQWKKGVGSSRCHACVSGGGGGGSQSNRAEETARRNNSNDASSRVFQGYRLALIGHSFFMERFTQAGASILQLQNAPIESKEEFRRWWQCEINKAGGDGVVVVVIKTCLSGSCFRGWLEEMEEEDWYRGGEDSFRVRFSTLQKAKKLVNAPYPEEQLLTDDWDEEIEKGGRVPV